MFCYLPKNSLYLSLTDQLNLNLSEVMIGYDFLVMIMLI